MRVAQRAGPWVLAFAWSDVSTPIQSIIVRRSLSPSSLTRTAVGLLCSRLSPQRGAIRAYHVPLARQDRFRFSLSADSVYLPMAGDTSAPAPAALPFWLRPVSLFGLFIITTFIESSRLLTMPSTLVPCCREAGSDLLASQFGGPSDDGGIRCRRALYSALPCCITS